ncbi:MAG: isoprenylcysteine carboxylmethyltransferase family protein [Deltaproteobacteria bacterium]|nr:isoprenylcysteine carboxylmethyltransferase family protein [Deltaproteobacteria bacterium]
MDVLRVVLAWAAFAVFHSLTVSEGYERRVRALMGERAFAGWHRLVFTTYSAAAFLLLVLHLRSLPDAPLYRVEGWPRILCNAAQGCGILFLLWTPWDLKEFVGLRQWERHRKGEPAADGSNDRLFTEKAYSIVRHPLYLGISVFLAFSPAQSVNTFVSTIMIVLYFYVGTFFEERRLLRKFGEAYRDYQRKVPRFLPLRWRTLSR